MGEKGTPKFAPAKAFLLDKLTVLVVSMVLCRNKRHTALVLLVGEGICLFVLRMPYPQLCVCSFTRGNWKNWKWGKGVGGK